MTSVGGDFVSLIQVHSCLCEHLWVGEQLYQWRLGSHQLVVGWLKAGGTQHSSHGPRKKEVSKS